MAGSVKYNVPKRETGDRPAGKGGNTPRSEVGNEKKADVRGTQEGGSRAEAACNPLKGAISDLKKQHPEHYADRGPHHGGTSHVRHEALGGLRPAK